MWWAIDEVITHEWSIPAARNSSRLDRKTRRLPAVPVDRPGFVEAKTPFLQYSLTDLTDKSVIEATRSKLMNAGSVSSNAWTASRGVLLSGIFFL
jgi:hypothetical protein